MTRLLLALAIGLSCASAIASDSVPKQLPPEQEAAAIRSAEATGLAMYRHDHAAAVATDAAFELPAFKSDNRVKGWVTEEHQGEIIVTFVDQTPSALYRVVVSKDGLAGPVMALKPAAPLNDYERGAVTARATALTLKFRPCSSSYNIVVLPNTGKPGDWVVYLLPGTTKNNVVPIGGTYRVDVSGSTIISQRSFTHTCIALQTVPNEVALMITHLLDPVPTEAHVFWSLWAKLPMYVATPPNGTIWLVDHGKIKLVQRKPGG